MFFSTRCSKKTLFKAMSEFLTLKMIPLALALALIKTRSFRTIGQKMLIIHENLEFSMAWENLPLKKGIFWPMGQKDGIFVLINSRANGKFRVKKSVISLWSIFFGKPCIWLRCNEDSDMFFFVSSNAEMQNLQH